MRKNLLTVLIVGSGLLTGQPSAVSAQADTAFRGRSLPQVLQPSGSVSCFADRAAITEYDRALVPEPGKPEVVLRSTPLESQTAGGGYKISLTGKHAIVRDEFMKASYRFEVYERRDDGVILIRGKGTAVEIIGIDPRNGSFVLTDVGAQTFRNGTTVWVGRCE